MGTRIFCGSSWLCRFSFIITIPGICTQEFPWFYRKGTFPNEFRRNPQDSVIYPQVCDVLYIYIIYSFHEYLMISTFFSSNFWNRSTTDVCPVTCPVDDPAARCRRVGALRPSPWPMGRPWGPNVAGWEKPNELRAIEDIEMGKSWKIWTSTLARHWSGNIFMKK